LNRGRLVPHFVGDRIPAVLDALLPTNQRMISGRPFGGALAIHRDHPDLGDAAFTRVYARRFDIDESKRGKVHLAGRQGAAIIERSFDDVHPRALSGDLP
jgi:hypothetical protein